jgi:hypothetical protein
MPTTVTLNFTAGTECRGYHIYGPYNITPIGDELYGGQWKWSSCWKRTNCIRRSTNAISIPAGAYIQRIKISANKAFQTMVDSSCYLNEDDLISYLTSSLPLTDKYLTVNYYYLSHPDIITSDGHTASPIYTSYAATPTAMTITITYYTEEEISGGIVESEDPMPEEGDGTPFIIEKYGENRHKYGVATGGIPISEDAEKPSFDSYIPNVWSSNVSLTIANTANVVQMPIWRDLLANAYGSGWSPCTQYEDQTIQYCRVNGCVYLRGFVYRAARTYAANSTILTLPEGYRPSTTVYKMCPLQLRAKNEAATRYQAYGVVTINTNGTVVLSLVKPVNGGNGVVNSADFVNDSYSWLNLNFGFRI